MSGSDYEWPKYPVGPKDHLEALGIISLNFSQYEHGLMVLLEHYFPKHLAEFFFDKLTNEEKGELLSELILSQEKDPKVKGAIAEAIRHFATCAANRHILMHARIRGVPSDDILALEKKQERRTRNDTGL